VALRAQASINLAATERNAARLCAALTGDASLCAVVKADASGHGAAAVARAALAGGASSLAVATAHEALALRAAGLRAPVLVMGAVSDEELPDALAARAELTAWDERFVQRVLRGAADLGRPVRLHVKLDTGMGRLGTRDPEAALAVAEAIVAAAPRLVLAGAMTHTATADDDPEFLAQQLAVFAPWVERMRRVAPIVAHAANSAATLGEPASHFDLVRCGIALHGGDPFNCDPAEHGLEPALELTSYVAAVKLARPGESVGYGRRFVAQRDTWIATLPIGYADGVRRAQTNNGEVLIGGRRYPIAGTVSMDNICVDLGPAEGDTAPVAVGEAGVLIGRSGAERITAEEVARRVGTINHEVLCGISSRVTRRYHRDGIEVDPHLELLAGATASGAPLS
jgi:alanine racemase